ncbi:hypothetical protein O181_092996 [Austropuccinia psidii MF-1]|uniref:Uncharacterized protein n=1 Tax=Austropuccinia psidii MF-1 TaxID=1389203 RepID=A0A9Q3PB55_9BASI|nr:hypothetical protein [Austropuccinia psidii MF-1]
MIQNIEDIIGLFCSYGLEFNDSDVFTHYWRSLIPALELEYKTSMHYLTRKTLAMLEKGLNSRRPYDTLKEDLVDIHPTASIFKIILYKEKHNSNIFIKASFKYAKERWDKSHKLTDFKLGEFVFVSTLSFNNIKGPMKLEDSFSGLFMIREIHAPNYVQLELTGKLRNKYPAFPVSLIKP